MSELDPVTLQATGTVVFNDSSLVTGPALPLLLPKDEQNDNYVRCRKSRIDRARELVEIIEKQRFDWSNVAVGCATFGLGALLSGWLADLPISESKGQVVFIGGACLFTGGLVLGVATYFFHRRSISDLAKEVLQQLPNEYEAHK